MPLLVVYSRFSRDSRILRETAQRIGWETLRLDGWQLPDWIDHDAREIAIFATMPDAQSIAEQFSRTLLGCPANWLPSLPASSLKRSVTCMPLRNALSHSDGQFVKSAITKHLPGKVRTTDELVQDAMGLHPDVLVYTAEPVNFLLEYRCFVTDGRVATMSAYRRHKQIFDENVTRLNEPSDEKNAALDFATSVLRASDVEVPPAVVLDVGYIDGRGWAVIEANECWASGVYHCDPVQVLEVLRSACIPDHPRSAIHDRWDFAAHYAAAVPLGCRMSIDA